MKYTLFYLKIVVLVLLVIVMLGMGACGIGLALIGIVNSLVDRSVHQLILILPGLFCGLLCSSALDALEYINDKWSWKV